MTDYDLGKARGRIVIDHDERGYRRAEGANDRLAKSAKRVAEGFVDADKAHENYRKQVRKTEQAEEALGRKQSDAQKSLNRLNEAQAVANRLKQDGKENTERYKQAVEAVNKAQNRYTEAVNDAAQAESKLNSEIAKVNNRFKELQSALASDKSINDATQKIKGLGDQLDKTSKSKSKIDVDTDSAMTKLKKLRKEHDGWLKALKVPGVVGNVGVKSAAVGGIGSGVLALGGLAGLAGGGLTGYGINGIMATVQAIGQLSGLAGLLPMMFGNLATTIGTVVIASQGMGDAFKAVAENDAEALSQALSKLSTSGQEMALAFNNMYPALEEFQKAVQQEFFKGLAEEMKQLSGIYMPILQGAFTDFAKIINGTIKDLADWAKQAGIVEDTKTIFENLKYTMGTLAPTARMLADIFVDIMKVSTDFGPSVAASFQTMIKDFRDFIQQARSDGSLAQWIQTGIDSFRSLMYSMKQFGQAFGTIFQIQNQYSGGLFGFIERISTAFNNWTKSTEGNAALNKFFKSITELADALTPVLASLANIVLGQIIPMFASFGTSIQPGILAFFKGFSDALNYLAPAMNQMQGPMNDLLKALGQILSETMKQLGPELPKMFRSFADAIMVLVPHIPDIAKEIAMLGTNFMEWMPDIMKDIGDILPWLIRLGDTLLILATVITGAVIQIVRWIGDLVTSLDDLWRFLGKIFGKMTEAISAGYDLLLNALGPIKDKIFEWLSDLPGKAFEAGKSIVSDLIDGLLDQLGPLGIIAEKIAGAISDHLPRSPAKKGPFSGRGWARYRGEKLAQDFAEGIIIGSGAASIAGGKLSKATESGMTQFVNNILEFSAVGQHITSLIGDIANNFFAIAKLATTNLMTGESIFPKKWQVTATPDERRRMKEDKAFQDQLKAQDEARKNAEQDAKKIRPDNRSPSPAGAELVTQVPKLDSKSTRRDVLAAIVGQAQQRGFKPEEIKAIVSTAIQESGLDPTKWDPTGKWLGLFQQDNSYLNRNDPNAQISEFLKRLQNLRASGGGSGNIWKDIFWLQQAPGAASAADAFNNGRQSYLSEIMSRSAEADKAVQEVLKNPQRPGGVQNLLPAQNSAARNFSDAALLSQIPQTGNRYVPASEFMNNPNNPQIGDLTKGLGDCTSTIEDLINIMDGKPTGSRSMATSNAAEWLSSRGFMPTNAPVPGAFNIAYSPSHMQATLPGGTNFNWGSQAAAEARGIGPNQGAYDPSLPTKYYRPVSGGMQRFGPRAPVPAPPPPFLSTDGAATINPMNDPTSPAAQSQDQFRLMNESLDVIASATQDQVSQQDEMINALRAQNPILDQAIKTAKDPNSTDIQVGSALDQISEIAKQQRIQDTAQSRYIADGLDSMATEIAGGRGMSQVQQDPIGTTANIVGGALGIVGDAFKIVDTGIKAIGAASNIADIAVRGIENTNDIYKIVDEIQKFYDLAAAVSQTVSDGLALAGVIAMAAGGGQDGGLTGSILQAASAVAGIVTSVIQTINAAIDIGQEVYNIGAKYVGKFLSKVVGAGQGSLLGDVRFLLDKNTMELKTWSGDNPSDKRTFNIPNYLGNNQPIDQQGKIRDINMYIGPGTDPNEAMNAAMWSIKTDNGVFTNSGY